jgi:acyl carrier protein
MKPSQEEIINTTCNFVTHIAEEWNQEAKVNADTLLVADMGFTSMDTLDLLSSLEIEFQCKLLYEQLVMQDGEYRQDLSISELARFVHESFDGESDDTAKGSGTT